MHSPHSKDHEEKYGIPPLDELGHDMSSLMEELFPGGEQEALRRLDEHMKRTVISLQEKVHEKYKSTKYSH